MPLRRTSRGVVPTPVGSAFLETARSTLAELELKLVTFDLTASAAGPLDHRTDVAPVDAPGIALLEVEPEPQVFVLLAGDECLVSPRPGGDALVIGDERPVVRGFVELALSVAGRVDGHPVHTGRPERGSANSYHGCRYSWQEWLSGGVARGRRRLVTFEVPGAASLPDMSILPRFD